MNPVEWLKARGCQEERYLGDGVYGATDGYQIWLCCERGVEFGLHYIALDARTMKALVDYDAELRRPRPVLPDGDYDPNPPKVRP